RVPRIHGVAEPDVGDLDEQGYPRGGLLPGVEPRQVEGPGLEDGLAQEHARGDRRSGIVALVERLLGPPRAPRDKAVGGLGDDLVDEEERGPMGDQPEDLRVRAHAALPCLWAQT